MKAEENPSITAHEQVFLTTAEAAAVIKTTAKTLTKARTTGELWGQSPPPYRKIGKRKILYVESELRDWLSSVAVTCTNTGFA